MSGAYVPDESLSSQPKKNKKHDVQLSKTPSESKLNNKKKKSKVTRQHTFNFDERQHGPNPLISMDTSASSSKSRSSKTTKARRTKSSNSALEMNSIDERRGGPNPVMDASASSTKSRGSKKSKARRVNSDVSPPRSALGGVKQRLTRSATDVIPAPPKPNHLTTEMRCQSGPPKVRDGLSVSKTRRKKTTKRSTSTSPKRKTSSANKSSTDRAPLRRSQSSSPVVPVGGSANNNVKWNVVEGSPKKALSSMSLHEAASPSAIASSHKKQAARRTKSTGSKSPKQKPKSKSLFISQSTSSCPKEQKLRQAFQLFDADHSGSIDKSELQQLMEMMAGGKPLSTEEVEALMRKADTSGNGEIGFTEFKELMSKRPSYIGLQSSEAAKSNDTPSDAQLLEIFQHFDADNSGCIDKDELKLLMNQLGHKLSDNELDTMINQVDTSGDGEISFEEFKELIAATSSPPMTAPSEDQLLEVFHHFDADDSGFIDKDELKLLMKQLGHDLSDAEIDTMMNQVDTSGDGEISFEEFKELILAATPPSPPQEIKTTPAEEQLLEVFHHFDADNSGFIDKDELKQLMKQLGHDLSDAEIDTMMNQVDTSGDGEISFEEFKELILAAPTSTSSSRSSQPAKKSRPSEDQLLDIFRHFDTDNSGAIDKNELKGLMKELGHDPSDAELDTMMNQADPDGDGEMSFQEFKLLFYGNPLATQQPQPQSSPETNKNAWTMFPFRRTKSSMSVAGLGGAFKKQNPQRKAMQNTRFGDTKTNTYEVADKHFTAFWYAVEDLKRLMDHELRICMACKGNQRHSHRCTRGIEQLLAGENKAKKIRKYVANILKRQQELRKHATGSTNLSDAAIMELRAHSKALTFADRKRAFKYGQSDAKEVKGQNASNVSLGGSKTKAKLLATLLHSVEQKTVKTDKMQMSEAVQLLVNTHLPELGKTVQSLKTSTQSMPNNLRDKFGDSIRTFASNHHGSATGQSQGSHKERAKFGDSLRSFAFNRRFTTSLSNSDGGGAAVAVSSNPAGPSLADLLPPNLNENNNITEAYG